MHTYELIHTARDSEALQQLQPRSDLVQNQNEASGVSDKPFPGSSGLCWLQKSLFFFPLSFLIKTKINPGNQIHVTSSE